MSFFPLNMAYKPVTIKIKEPAIESFSSEKNFGRNHRQQIFN